MRAATTTPKARSSTATCRIFVELPACCQSMMTEAVAESLGENNNDTSNQIATAEILILIMLAVRACSSACVSKTTTLPIRGSHTHATHIHTPGHVGNHVSRCVCVSSSCLYLDRRRDRQSPRPSSPTSPPSSRRHSINIYSGLASGLVYIQCASTTAER